MHRYYKRHDWRLCVHPCVVRNGFTAEAFLPAKCFSEVPHGTDTTPPAQGSRMHFHQMQLNVALLFQLTIWMRGVRMTCLYTSWCRWEKNGKGAMFSVHTDLWGKKRGGVGCSTSARSVSDGEGHHCFRKHGFEFPNPEHYSADCEKVAAVFFFSCLPHLSCLCWSGCAMLDLSHVWIVLYVLRSPTSLLVMHGVLLKARRCVSLSSSSLMGDYATVLWVIIISNPFSVGG